jgi:hypothetical protein
MVEIAADVVVIVTVVEAVTGIAAGGASSSNKYPTYYRGTARNNKAVLRFFVRKTIECSTSSKFSTKNIRLNTG